MHKYKLHLNYTVHKGLLKILLKRSLGPHRALVDFGLSVHLFVHTCGRLSTFVGTLTFIGFLPNFIYGLLPSNSYSSLNMGFVPPTKIADKMAAACQFAFLDTLP